MRSTPPLHPTGGIMFNIMSDQGNHQRTKRVFILPTAVVVTLVTGFMCQACSSSGLTSSSSDAAITTSSGDAAITFGSCSLTTDYLKCNGNMVLYCECVKNGPITGHDPEGNPYYRCDSSAWVGGTVCTVACNVTVAPQTGCIASEQPVPECSQDGPACWNGNITYCQNGYPLQIPPCSSGTQCTPVTGCGGLCLDSSAIVDPRCPATTGTSGFCEDNTAYFCGCGYLLGSTVCGAPPNNCILGGGNPQCGLPP